MVCLTFLIIVSLSTLGSAATISGVVWNDANKDGLQDVAEVGIPAVSLQLLAAGTSTTIDTVVSGTDGAYQFTGVAVGNYEVQMILPAYNLNVDYIISLRNIGVDDSIDNDFHAVTAISPVIKITDAGASTTSIDAGLSIPYDTVSYSVADNGSTSNADTIYRHSSISNTWTQIGATGTFDIEAIANDPQNPILYGANGDIIGTFDVASGIFTGIGSAIGTIDGPEGPHNVDDIDGLTFDVPGQCLWAAERRSSMSDLIFKIDPVTGQAIPNAFGDGVDYVVIPPIFDTGELAYVYDADDIAIDPVNGDLYATINDGGAGGMLVVLDKRNGALKRTIGALTVHDIEGIGFFNSGTLFASSGTNTDAANQDRFFRVDKTDATMVELAAIDATGTDVDFEAVDSFTGPGNTISGIVYLDSIEDRLYQTGENLIENVDVQLWLDADNDDVINPLYDLLLQTESTDDNGVYSFDVYATGSFITRIDPDSIPQGNVFSTDNIESAVFGGTDMTDPGNNFGLKLRSQTTTDSATASIGNYVWLDENGDGYQDRGEVGIPNVMVTLTNAVTGASFIHLTDATGGYLFTDLPTGSYTVGLHALNYSSGGALENLLQTLNPILPAADGGNQALDYSVTVSNGVENLSADFGFNWNSTPDVQNNTGNSVLGDRVWNDANGDGNQDPNEVGIANVTVNLYRDLNASSELDGVYDTLVATTNTDSSGNYIFRDIPPGVYVVEMASGEFLGAGDLVGFTQTGDPDNTLDDKTSIPIILAPGDVYLNADFGYQSTGTTGTIGDTIWLDADLSGTATMDTGEPGLTGVSVSLIKDFNGDGIWTPLGSDGLPNTSDDEPILATDETDADGIYGFSGLPLDDGGGDAAYIVWVNDSANVLSALGPTYDSDGLATPDVSAVTLSSASPTNNNQGFSYGAPGGSIGDRIWDDVNNSGDSEENSPAEPGLAGVTVELYIDRNGDGILSSDDALLSTMITDIDGNYSFEQLNFGNYFVQVDTTTLPSGYNATPTYDPDGTGNSASAVTLTTAAPASMVQDFSYYAAGLNSVGNRVWNDTNGDGVQTAGEPGIPNVTVYLSDGATTTTDENGYYLFSNLENGDYTVSVDLLTLPAKFSTNPSGEPDGDGDSQSTVTLTGTQDRLRNFGYQPLGAIGDTVWYDSDNSGNSAQGTEPGIAGVRVNLIQDNNNNGTIDSADSVVATQLTDDNGHYLFSGVGYIGSTSIANDTFSTTSYTNGTGWAGDWIETDTDGGSAGAGDIQVFDGYLRIRDDNNQIERAVDLSSYTSESISLSFDVRQSLDNTMESADPNWVDLQISTDGGTTWETPSLESFTQGLSQTFTRYSFDISSYATADTVIRFITSNLMSSDEGIAVDNIDISYTGDGANYIVQVDSTSDALRGLVPTYDATGAADHLSSVYLSSSSLTDLGQDFSYYQDAGNTDFGMIGDTVWSDSDNSGGSIQSSEPGISNVTVNLIEDLNGNASIDSGENIIATAITDAQGVYLFTGLATQGQDLLAEDDFSTGLYDDGTGWDGNWIEDDQLVGDSTDGDIQINEGHLQIWDAGNSVERNLDLSTYSSDTVTLGFDVRQTTASNDGMESDNWVDLEVSSDGGTNWTALQRFTQGFNTAFTNMTFDISAYTTADASIRFVTSTAMSATEGIDVDNLVITRETGSKSYVVQVDDASEPLTGATPTYDVTGTADHLSAVTLSPASTTHLDQDFSYYQLPAVALTGAIGDTIWFDADGESDQDVSENGIEGVLIELYNAAGTVLYSIQRTDENGQYLFGDIDTSENYLVKVADSNFATGAVLEGLSASGDPEGNTDNQTLADLNSSAIDLSRDFGYAATSNPSSIGNQVFLDVNANGIYEPGDGETAIAGVTIDLYRDLNGNGTLDANEPLIATDTTDSSTTGNYLFSNLPAGDYVIDISDRNEVLSGSWQSLGTSGTDNHGQTDPYAVTVTVGNDLVHADFGYFQTPASLGNLVWWDFDNSGTQNIDSETGLLEAGIAGLKLTLTIVYPDNTTIEMVTVTDTNGLYSFDNLLLDEQYNGSGSSEPTYSITASTAYHGVELTPTLADVGNNVGNSDTIDSDEVAGVDAFPTQGLNSVTNRSSTIVPASYDFGFDPTPTLAVVTSFTAATEDGQTMVHWETGTEIDTLGFRLERMSDAGWQQIGDMVFSNPFGIGTQFYSLPDTEALSGNTYTWHLIEVDTRGQESISGPYTIAVGGAGFTYNNWASDINWGSADGAATADPDGDGLSNLEEFLAGTDPLDINSLLKIISIKPVLNGIELQWESVSERTYSIEMSATANGPFLPIATGVQGLDTVRSYIVPVTAEHTLFFRVVVE